MQSIANSKTSVNKRAGRALAVIVFIILTAFSAFVRIPLPFTPVPLTLQTLFVIFSGALLGRRLGVFSQAGYVLLGLTGFEVFTGFGSGTLYLLGPTGGYLVGFILASFITGKLFSEAAHQRRRTFVVFLCAGAVILFSGTLWLKAYLSCSFSQAFLLGFLPFVPGDLLKVVFATVAFDKIHSRIKESLY